MMWTLTDTLVILGSLAVHAGLFHLPLNLGNKFNNQGEKLLASKERQLQTNPILRLFSNLVERDKLVPAIFIIALLIFLKSLGMLIGGLIFIGILLVPVQGAMMKVIGGAMAKKGIDPGALRQTQNLQLTAMLILNAAGNWIGYQRWYEGLSFSESFDRSLVPLAVLVGISLIFVLLAARHEVKFFKAHRTLIG